MSDRSEAAITVQMGPFAPGPSPTHPDQILRALNPLVEQAAQAMQGGAPGTSVLREAMLTAYLIGTGMPVNSAQALVRQWRPGSGPGQAPAGPELVAQLERFLHDEITAIRFYGELAQRAEQEHAGPMVVDYIRIAMEDEQKHFRMVQGLYRDLTGRYYEVQPTPVSFTTLQEGLLRAMNDEYEAMEGYRQVYLTYRNDRIRDIFFELLTDELEHATRFNYALQVIGQQGAS